MLHHITGGAWGAVDPPHARAATRTLPLLALLFLPLAFGMHHLYEWAHADVVAHDAVLQAQGAPT